jgi:hypothetical protein
MEHVDLSDEQFKAPELPGMPRDIAFTLFHMLVDRKYAVSLKHLGGYYFIEVPVALRGDPCYGRQAEIIALASNAGCEAIQTGPTMRIIS